MSIIWVDAWSRISRGQGTRLLNLHLRSIRFCHPWQKALVIVIMPVYFRDTVGRQRMMRVIVFVLLVYEKVRARIINAAARLH